jgi:hypothetical protein
MQHHSAEIRLIHPEFGLKAFTQLMMDTGGTATVCDPRVNAPTKDVVQLNSPCALTSAYEIWGTVQVVRYQGQTVYRSFATPAVFDPITVKNPSNPTELVYAWDPRMASSKVHNTDWSTFRGCQRESYAQPGYWQNTGGSNASIRARAADFRVAERGGAGDQRRHAPVQDVAELLPAAHPARPQELTSCSPSLHCAPILHTRGPRRGHGSRAPPRHFGEGTAVRADRLKLSLRAQNS